MFRTNLVVHHQEHGLIYCITQSGTIMQASLSAKKLCISLVINTLQYDARYIQRHINTLQYDARYIQRHINTLQYDTRYTQRLISCSVHSIHFCN